METWQAFLFVGIVLCISEVFIPGFVMFPIGLGFAITAGLVPFVPSLAGDFIVLAVVLTIVLALSRVYLRRSGRRPELATNVDALVGKEARVTETIEPTSGTGRVKVYADTFTATSAEGSAIAAGSKVIIVRMDGNRVVVRKES